jgi:hypothetical protein
VQGGVLPQPGRPGDPGGKSPHFYQAGGELIYAFPCTDDEAERRWAQRWDWLKDQAEVARLALLIAELPAHGHTLHRV